MSKLISKPTLGVLVGVVLLAGYRLIMALGFSLYNIMNSTLSRPLQRATLFILTCAHIHLLTPIKIFQLVVDKNISTGGCMKIFCVGPFGVVSRLTRIEPGNNPFVIAKIGRAHV